MQLHFAQNIQTHTHTQSRHVSVDGNDDNDNDGAECISCTFLARVFANSRLLANGRCDEFMLTVWPPSNICAHSKKTPLLLLMPGPQNMPAVNVHMTKPIKYYTYEMKEKTRTLPVHKQTRTRIIYRIGHTHTHTKAHGDGPIERSTHSEFGTAFRQL